MARDVHQQWDDDDRYSEEDGDDTPILSYRYDKQKPCTPYNHDVRPERERRWAVTLVAKCSLFSTAMILFCVLMYIPVYNRANEQLPKVAVAGWSIHTNRNTKIYVQPENVTSIHEPKDICPKNDRNEKNKLFLLIVVCSATGHFEQRSAIRDTWGSYNNYLQSGKIFNETQEKYKNYNYTYDLYKTSHRKVRHVSVVRYKRDISGISGLLPELAKALTVDLEKATEQPEQRFDESDEMLPEFDMNKEINAVPNYDYDYESNVMKIPPKGYEDNPNLDSILNLLKNSKDFPKKEILEEEAGGNTDDTKVDFKLVFLLGLPTQDNDTDVQGKIEEEVEKYGDVIQEGFLDSYNNLTLKSIMMLKWVTNNCNQSARYILKTDDDMYINVPKLVMNLRNRSKVYDKTAKPNEKEYLLIGDLICGAKPVHDASNKWYSPRYMYNGRVYPHYLSGTGYVMSADTAHALYEAALRTDYFHLEDIYITGLCAGRARPRITPRDEPDFSYSMSQDKCAAHSHISTHRVPPSSMRDIEQRLVNDTYVDKCERKRLTQVRQDRLRPKTKKKKPKFGHSRT